MGRGHEDIIATYKEIRNAAMDGTELLCERETGNAHDPFSLEISSDNITASSYSFVFRVRPSP